MYINLYEIFIPLTSESGGGTSEGGQALKASPACPSDQNSMKDKVSRAVRNDGFKQWLQNFNLRLQVKCTILKNNLFAATAKG